MRSESVTLMGNERQGNLLIIFKATGALKCVWMSCWTLPSTAAEEPGATRRQQFKGEAKCSALLMAEKVIFYQSISNDDKTPGGIDALLLSHSHQSKNTGREGKKIDF